MIFKAAEAGYGYGFAEGWQTDVSNTGSVLGYTGLLGINQTAIKELSV